eukprot:SAG25_NODE_2673_length_1456_cov_1.845247_1_plen_360_part_01
MEPPPPPSYARPADAIASLVEGAGMRTPSLAVSPTGGWALQLSPPPMPSIAQLALPELRLGGLRFSPTTLFPTRMDVNGGRCGTEPKLLALPVGVRACGWRLWLTDSCGAHTPPPLCCLPLLGTHQCRCSPPPPGPCIDSVRPHPVVCQAPVTNSQGITKDVSLHEVALEGLPAGYSLSYVQWAPRGGGLAFMARRTAEPAADYELWHADWAHSGKRSCRARRLLPHRRFVSAGHVTAHPSASAHHRPPATVHCRQCSAASTPQDPGFASPHPQPDGRAGAGAGGRAGAAQNAVTGPPFVFSPDGRALLVRAVPEDWGEPPAAPATPAGPVSQDNSGGGRSGAATYQDLIGSAHEAQLFA